jgi:Ca2+-transporting ATPase
MITGDHPATAASIATTVGIAHGPDDVVNGHSAGAHRTASVFARVRPEHKTAIVAALQDDGEVVAMTGDGVNDAPALRRADVGVAMGRRGTEVAKQAADLVLVEDDLSAMVRAIAEGRRAYDNVRRFLRYALSGGLTEVLVMLLGPALGLPVPLKPGQILWVNLLTHGLPGVAMGSEAAEPDVLARPPRPPQEPLVDRRLASGVAGYAVLMTVACFGAAAWAKQLERPWQSYLFVTLTLCQLALGLLLRPRWRRNELNPMLLGAVLVNVALIVAAVTWAPLRELLRTEPIGATDLLRCLAVTACFTAAAFVGRMLAHLPTLARADRARR